MKRSRVSRRQFMQSGVVIAGSAVTLGGLTQGQTAAEPKVDAKEPWSWIQGDHRALVSRSDLIYRSPVAQSVEGQPIGNGVMGTLVWTTPSGWPVAGFWSRRRSRTDGSPFVELESRRGETCRLRNPWGKLSRFDEVGGPVRELNGDVLVFATRPGHRYRMVPAGDPLQAPRRVWPPRVTEPASYKVTLPSGSIVTGTLGRT